MERVAIVGLSLQDTEVHELERVERPTPDRFEPFLRDLADEMGSSELVLLATCNRVEVAFARESGHLPGEADLALVAKSLGIGEQDPCREHFVLRSGAAALRHLLRVSCSLESLVVGEDQILSQVREAHVRARSIGLCGPLLTPWFEAAVQVGKEVRTRTELSRKPVSVVSIGVGILCERLREHTSAARIAVLGAGKTGRQAAFALKDAGLAPALIVNRSLEQAQRLASLVGAQAQTLDQFRTHPQPLDAIVSATSSPDPVLTRAELESFAPQCTSGNDERPALVGVDLAMPRDLEPGARGVELVDLEVLRNRSNTNRRLRVQEMARAEVFIERKMKVATRRFEESRLAATLAEVMSESQEVLEHELVDLGRGRLAQLSDADREAVERWARRALGRVAHVPIQACKRMAHDMPGALDRDDEEPQA